MISMWYDKQDEIQKNEYKNMLAIIGSLSNLFSESKEPLLYYRAHENCFCKYFNAKNLARSDCSADAVKDKIGIGLKTWVGGNTQKVAEFGKFKTKLDKLNDDQLIIKVSELRNDRILTTMKMYGLDQMIYHVVIRSEAKMTIKECSFDMIDINHIVRISKKDGDNTRYFTDRKHIYCFNKAKTTLYMLFDQLELLDEIEVNVYKDPFTALNIIFPKMSNVIMGEIDSFAIENKRRKLALKLYKETKNGNIVSKKSGLNAWNGRGRERDCDEVYIPFNKCDRDRIQNKDFFPSRDKSFDLMLPDGTHLSAKICQADGKSIMSNPNKALGKWLLRDVLKIEKGTLITYELLQEKGFDTVLFEKIDESHYTIDFTNSMVYDELYNDYKKIAK